MKTLLRVLLLLLAWAGLGRTVGWAQTIAPFSCDGTFYQVRQSGTGASAFSVLYRVDRSTTTYTTSPLTGGTYGTTGALGTNIVVNGLAYNSQDGYMYALTYPADNGTPTVVPRLYKIGSNGIQDLGATNLPIQQFATGTFDKTGHYYVTTRNNTDATYRNTIFRFDLNSATPRNATQLPLQNTAGAAANVNFFDVAYNPSDNNLYGVFTNLGLIYKIVIDNVDSPTKGTVTSIGTAGTAVTLGSNFFDVAGNMYAYSNEGNFYSIDVQTGAATQLSTVASVSNSDGASCINPDQRIDVVKEVTRVAAINSTTFDVDFVIRVKNTSTVTDQNVQINDFLWSGTAGAVLANTTFSSVSGKTASNVQVTAGPTLTADPSNSNPTLALALRTGFTGVGANSQLLSGTQALTAGQAATITFTVRVTYPTAAGVPGIGATNGQPFNTAYATSTADSNPGYVQNTTSGALFAPDNLQASDLSNNSASLPTTASGDDAYTQPTPIYYSPAILGSVFEDMNYGGGAGRSQLTSNGPGVSAARVELYDNNVTNATTFGRLVAATTVDASGNYSFVSGVNGVPTLLTNGSYIVRVVNSTIQSSRPLNSGTVASTLVPVQTFLSNGVTEDTQRVGGEYPVRTEAAQGTTPGTGGTLLSSLTPAIGTTAAQSLTTVTLPATGPRVGVDFGFNFDVVVNTNSTGQGSLAQFITNANGLTNTNLAQVGQTAGVENSIFMIYGGANVEGYTPRTGLNSLLTNGVAVITPTTLLPAITDAGTAINGATQTANIGNTNTGTLGTAGTVGVGADGIAGTSDDTALSAVDRPEVQITGASTLAIGLDVRASSTTIRGLSILGFGSGTNNNLYANIRVGNPNITGGGNYTGILLENNYVGVDAKLANFTSTNTSTTNADNIRVIGANGNGTTTGATASIIQNNLIGYATGKGIGLEGNAAGTIASVGFVVRNNEIRNNSIGNNNFDGVDIEYSNGTVVTGNLVVDNGGVGVDMYGSTGNNTIQNNTIIGNGRNNGENAGVRLFGSGNVVSQNIIRDNVGSGVSVQATGLNNVISLNSISGNGTVVPNGGTVATGAIGIDLFNSTDNAASGTSTFVTLNDDGDGDSGANGLTNMPVIRTATIRNGTLYLTGFARPGALLEFYIATPNAAALNTVGANFGQGQSYLFSRTEGITGNATATLNDLDATTGSYGQSNAPVNGFYQGTETNQNRFSYAIPLSSLTTAQQTALTATNVRLTATATQVALVNGNQGTSEFSGIVPVQLAPVANNDYTTTTPGTTVTLTVTSNDQNAIDPTTVALNGLAAGSTTAVTVTGGTFTFLSNGQVSFVPAAGFTGIATVPYTVNNTSGTTSNTAFISVSVSGTTFNLATSYSVTPGSTVNAGSSVSYTVVSSNPGTVAATSVVETVQLPAGLTTTGFTVGGNSGTISNGVITFTGGTYSQTTGLLTLNIGNLAANGGSASTALTFPAPLTSPLVVTANISGAGGTETTTTDNTVVSTINITPRFDVTTAINGPTTVTAGNEVTYTVVTSNLSSSTSPANANSVSPAVNVVQTVSLSGNLTGAGIYASNGGTVAYNSTQNATVITFPAIGVLAAGQSQVNTISFTAPSASFPAPIATVTSGLTGTNIGDLNSPSVGTDNNTAQLNGATSRPTITPATRTGTEANVYTSISASAANVAPGANITLSITVGNAGAAAASGVQETVTLPTGLTFSNLNGGTYNATTGVLTFPALTSTLAAGATQTYSVTFAAPQQGFVLATAAVTTSTPDAVPADNLAQTKIEVSPVVDVATTLAGPVIATPGQTVSYTVTTASNGPAAANNVQQTVQLPTGLTNVQVNSLNATSQYDAITGTLTILFTDPLAAGFSQTNTISFTAPAGAATLNISAAVSTSSAETILANNTALVTTALTPTADVAISVTAPATATVGNPVPYAVSVTNNGASVATGVAATLQLPAGLGTTNVTFPGGTSADTYNNTTGLVTFASVATLANGASTTRVVVVTMPDASQISAVGQVATTSYDAAPANNYATVATTAATATTTTADLRATTATATTITANAGSPVTITPVFNNLGSATANNVVPQLMLVPGLTGVTVTDGGVTRNADYNATTGVVTFQSVGSLASGAQLPGTYSVTFNAPATGPVLAVASIYSTTSDGALANNTVLTTVTVSPQADAQTSIAGPASAQPGSRVTYEITTSNNSTAVSPSTNVMQTVTIPGTPANLTFSAGANSAVVNGNTVVTFPTVASMAPGVAGAVTNFISFTTPATATALTITANVTSAVDINTAATSNSASVTTIGNNAPVAYNVVNNLLSTGEVRFNQVIENTATTAQLISPLVATDVNVGQVLTYTLTSVPTSGSLYIGTSTTALGVGSTISATQASQLRYLPTAGFVGNAFFTYTATDNATVPVTNVPVPATSNTALYTIAVGQDVSSVYTLTTVKGGATPYQTGDVIANVFDANSGIYNSATPQAVVKDGVTSATLVTTNLPAGVSSSFPAGVGFNITDANQVGQIVVTNNRLLVAGTYTVRIATVDANGGINTRDVTFTIGVRPLPVELVSFAAKAVGQDAQLVWRTAQELRNDHFTVERSFDGKTFSSVAQVAGQGTTTLATDYRFTDAQVGAKVAGQPVYYRLRQVDTDGTSSFSSVQVLTFSTIEAAISLYPNPATTTATLNLTSLPQGSYQVSIIDAVGRVVSQGRYEAGTTPMLTVQELPVGSYQVLVSGKDFKKSLRFIKQ